MPISRSGNRREHARWHTPRAVRSERVPLAGMVACLAAALALAAAAMPKHHQQPAAGESGAVATARDAGASQQGSKAPSVGSAEPKGATPQKEGESQIGEQTAQILKLAMDLKAEVDKTNKDVLSLRVIRKADEIQRLAHSARLRMNREAKPNSGAGGG